MKVLGLIAMVILAVGIMRAAHKLFHLLSRLAEVEITD